jgi:bacteriorhodopsin
MYEMSLNQFELVVNVFSFTIAAMGAATAFLFLQRSEVLPRYRAVVAISGLVTLIATYNYFRLYNSWHEAFVLVNGVVKYTGHGYNDTYRYADWLLTVPLLVIVLVLVLDLPPRQVRLRSTVLGLQAAEMILLGYPGQISTVAATRWLWWGAAMVPFAIIIQQLYIGLADAVRTQPTAVRGLIVGARFMTVLVWCFYPVVYVLPLVGVTGSTEFIATQIGYAGADLLAKAAYGIMIYTICVRKTQIERDGAALVSPAMPARALRA